MSRRIAVLMLALALGGCCVPDDGSFSQPKGGPKDQHRIEAFCIDAKHTGDYLDFRNDVMRAINMPDVPRCSKEIEADHVISIKRWGTAAGDFQVTAIITDIDGHASDTYVSAGKLRPHENEEHAAHRLIERRKDYFQEKLGIVLVGT